MPLCKEFCVNLQTIRVYKDLIISTIVDSTRASISSNTFVYKDLIISTIVDLLFKIDLYFIVYKDLIISTIVDKTILLRFRTRRSIKT